MKRQKWNDWNVSQVSASVDLSDFQDKKRDLTIDTGKMGGIGHPSNMEFTVSIAYYIYI